MSYYKGKEMETAKDIADNLIMRAKAMQQFIVERYLDEPPFTGRIPFDIKHIKGGPYQFTVHAVDMAEAETMVDDWLKELEDE
jgi:hypothetical protein